jgi:tRNA G46 methylase TrmB
MYTNSSYCCYHGGPEALRDFTKDKHCRDKNKTTIKRQKQKKNLLEIGSKQGRALATRWLSEASQNCLGQNIDSKLSFKLVDAKKGVRVSNIKC